MFSYLSPESRVPAEHPLRSIKMHTDRVLRELSGEFDTLYARTGRPSIPPEQLLKAQLLMALYSVRSDRLFCQMLDYNLLFRWFLDMSLDEEGLDQSNFSRLRERLVREDLAQRFFDAVVRIARENGLLSSEHLTVDGTLIEAWAGTKSFKPKDGPPPSGDGRGGVDFRGQPRTNDTHASIGGGQYVDDTRNADPSGFHRTDLSDYVGIDLVASADRLSGPSRRIARFCWPGGTRTRVLATYNMTPLPPPAPVNYNWVDGKLYGVRLGTNSAEIVRQDGGAMPAATPFNVWGEYQTADMPPECRRSNVVQP
jgi:transposase